MNNQAKLNLLKQLLTFFGALAVGAGWLSSGQETTLITDLMTIAGSIGAFISVASILWSVYSHYGMKKIPDKAVGVILPPQIPIPPIGSRIDLAPLTGKAQIVG